jgi:hypothetical protein
MGNLARTAMLLAVVLCHHSVAHTQELPTQPLSLAGGRVTLGTDLSIAMTPQEDDDGAWFNYTDYEHNALRLLRLGVTADVRLTDRVSVLTEVRSENGGAVAPYALYVRVRPWGERPLVVQAGRIPPTFGAFSRRGYGAGNPLIGYPLAYQYLTAVRPDALPASTEDVRQMRARGWRPSYPIGSLETAPGLPLITAFRWDTGVQVRYGRDALNGSVSLTNGTLSDPHTRDNNGGKQVTGRVQWQPGPAVTLGTSASYGAYVADAALANATLLTGTGGSAQRALGVDGELSGGHWLLRGEFIRNTWQIPTLSGALGVSSLSVEGRYKVLPGLYAAGRVDRLSFDELRFATHTGTWDAPVTRLETGLGYYLRPNLLAKAAYQHNWRDGGPVRKRGLFATQLHFWL